MSKYLATLVIGLAVVAAGIGPACGSPSFRGYTGLVVVPTCDTLKDGEWNVGVMTENVNEFHANDIFVNYGAVDNLEVGFNSVQPLDTSARETLINAKYQFMIETDSRAGVAFGLTDLTNEIDATAYAVASKSIGRGIRFFDGEITNLRAHVGIGGGSLDGAFVGFSAFLGNRAMLSFEWDSKNVNVGFKFSPVRGFRLHAGWFDATDRSDFGIGASYGVTY